MRCAVYSRSSSAMTRSRLSSKSKPVSITRVSPTVSSDNVSVVDPSSIRQPNNRHQDQHHQRLMLHKPVKSEVGKRGGQRGGTGGRHLQPPSGNNSKLKHECPFDGCPWRFATPYKLRRHIKSHTKETPYQCKECGRGFSVRYNLLMHIQTIHSAPHKYKCPVTGCKEAFHTQPRLNGHLRKIHKKDWKQLQVEQGKDNAPIGSNKRSSSSSSTSSDYVPVIGEEPFPLTRGEEGVPSTKWHHCIDCGKEFTSQAKLSAHMKAHSGNFHCTVQGCSRSFQTSDKLAKHLDSSHKSIPCPSKGCDRVFLKQSQLKNHLRVHNSKYTCPKQECNLKFDNEVDYNDHLTVHMGYSIPCPFKHCNLTFPTHKRLELHYRVAHLNNKEGTDMLLSQFTQADKRNNCSTSSNDNTAVDTSNYMEALELPDLKVEDVEAVMAEHTNWTGDQIETFLKSLDIEELDCGSSLKSSLSGYDYESDSGYSTHEVSPMGGSTHYSSALSPAITPVTPSPILSSASSTSSPVPFCLYQDDMFPHVHPTTPNTPSSNTDHHFFGGADFSLLPPHPTQCPSSSEQMFQSPSVCPTDGSHSVHAFQPIPSPQLYVNINHTSKGCVQSVLPPISNVSDIEANRHSVTVVPNSFCTNATSSVETTEVVTSSASSNAPNSATPQFDNFLDGYLNMLQAEQNAGSKQTSTCYESQTCPVDSNNKDTKDFPNFKLKEPSPVNGRNDKIENACLNPTVKTEKDGKYSRKSSCSSTDTQHPVGNQMSSESELRLVSNDNGRLVIAQVLSPPKQILGNVHSKPSAARLSKVKGKGRHHSASVSMKGHQKGKKKTSWPKSMNSGNLMAFRNFILGKLKHNPPVSCSYTPPGELLSDISSKSVPLTQTCFSLSSDDLFSDIGFNPDTLLTSERSMDSSCFSPFSHHSGSISPSPVPMSPSLESSMHFTSLSSLSSDLSPCPAEGGSLDIDGFIQCLSVDPVSQGFKQNFHTQLADEFCSILKTDADPLLGGLS